MANYPIVFLGNGPVATASLEALANNDRFTVQAVITKRRPHSKDPAPVEELSSRLGLTTHFASTKQELDQLLDSGVLGDILVGLVVDYGVIISSKSIAHFYYGIVNSHFSLLPEWRGADPISFAILSGQAKTGVSLMVIDEGLDTGPLITQKSLPIDPNDTTPTLTDKLVRLSNNLLSEWLPKYLDKKVKPHRQPHPDRATYSRKLTKQDGTLDFTKPAVDLERQIRAFAGWPKSRTQIPLKSGTRLDVIITKAHLDTRQLEPGIVVIMDDNLLIGTTDQSLVIDEIQPAGKKEMPIRAFLNGYGKLI